MLCLCRLVCFWKRCGNCHSALCTTICRLVPSDMLALASDSDGARAVQAWRPKDIWSRSSSSQSLRCQTGCHSQHSEIELSTSGNSSCLLQLAASSQLVSIRHPKKSSLQGPSFPLGKTHVGHGSHRIGITRSPLLLLLHTACFVLLSVHGLLSTACEPVCKPTERCKAERVPKLWVRCSQACGLVELQSFAASPSFT